MRLKTDPFFSSFSLLNSGILLVYIFFKWKVVYFLYKLFSLSQMCFLVGLLTVPQVGFPERKKVMQDVVTALRSRASNGQEIPICFWLAIIVIYVSKTLSGLYRFKTLIPKQRQTRPAQDGSASHLPQAPQLRHQI